MCEVVCESRLAVGGGVQDDRAATEIFARAGQERTYERWDGKGKKK